MAYMATTLKVHADAPRCMVEVQWEVMTPQRPLVPLLRYSECTRGNSPSTTGTLLVHSVHFDFIALRLMEEALLNCLWRDRQFLKSRNLARAM